MIQCLVDDNIMPKKHVHHSDIALTLITQSLLYSLSSLSQSQSGSSEDSRRSLIVGVASMVLSLLSSAWFPLDLSAHQDALMLAGNLLAGAHLPATVRVKVLV